LFVPGHSILPDHGVFCTPRLKRRQTNTRKFLHLFTCIGLVLFLCLAVLPSALAQEQTDTNHLRYHGMRLDDQHRLFVLESPGKCSIVLDTRERVEGGPAVYVDTVTGEEKEAIRVTEGKVLATISVRPMRTPPSNPLGIPALDYEIRLEGPKDMPDFQKHFVTTSKDVLDRVQMEFGELLARLNGIERDALMQGILLSLNALYRSGYLPAKLSEAQLKAGEKRGLTRRSTQVFLRNSEKRRAANPSPKMGEINKTSQGAERPAVTGADVAHAPNQAAKNKFFQEVAQGTSNTSSVGTSVVAPVLAYSASDSIQRATQENISLLRPTGTTTSPPVDKTNAATASAETPVGAGKAVQNLGPDNP
jgi:hypothetical protein